ncbi:hypothetical protein V0288_19630 [Pannus brasiliensis CCIBt3594]|uniref:Uncharacterized protein n=1 Tax=Pannus brasiliensis CCIBt3594 TaxID=1427578 RepID=A0AAW9QXK3_9CHRO
MWQRLFLAITLAFPLYLTIELRQSPPLTDSVARRSDIPERVNRKLDRKIEDFQQKLQQVRSSLLDK